MAAIKCNSRFNFLARVLIKIIIFWDGKYPDDGDSKLMRNLANIYQSI
jgi:hypothetical protein